MIKINVFHIERFLETVNQCVDEVKMITPDGKKQNINRQEEIQFDLRCKYWDNKGFLRLELEIPNPKDYFKIVFFSLGDC